MEVLIWVKKNVYFDVLSLLNFKLDYFRRNLYYFLAKKMKA